MTVEFIILRIIHIVFGTIWVGGAIYLSFILVPRLEKLGREIQGPVMGAISNITALVLTTSGAITILAGTYMGLRLRWGRLDSLVTRPV